MQTLSNGYKLPQDGDLGDVWFDALEDNITRVNDHSHNGADSEKLTADAVLAYTDTIANGDFTLDVDVYKVTKTLPATMLVDTTTIEFRDATTREKIYLKYELLTVSQITIYSNTPLDLLVVYGS